MKQSKGRVGRKGELFPPRQVREEAGLKPGDHVIFKADHGRVEVVKIPGLQKNYPSRYIAVKNGKVVASGREFGKVYDAAVRRVKKDFVTGYILSGEPFVLDTRLQHLHYTV